MTISQSSRLLHGVTAFGSANRSSSNFFSFKALSSRRFTTPSENLETELYRRIFPVQDGNVSVVPILDQWAAERRPVYQNGLQFIIRRLRSSKRYRHALQVIYFTNFASINSTENQNLVIENGIHPIHCVRLRKLYSQCGWLINDTISSVHLMLPSDWN